MRMVIAAAASAMVGGWAGKKAGGEGGRSSVEWAFVISPREPGMGCGFLCITVMGVEVGAWWCVPYLATLAGSEAVLARGWLGRARRGF